MGLKIEQTTDEPGTLNVLVYGQPGVGKTRFIGTTFPKFKTLIASAESGLLSLNNIKDDKGKTVKFDHVKVEKFEDLEDIRKFIQFEKHDYTCLAIDSGTEIQNICMEYILRQEGRAKAQIQDWGTLGDKMASMVRTLRDTNINLIMTALIDESKDESTGEYKALPAFKGKFQQLVAGYFDEVMYAYAESKKDDKGNLTINYKMLTRNAGKYVGKDRSGKLPAIIEPDFCKMYETIYKKENNK
jgi:hypothetical protein